MSATPLGALLRREVVTQLRRARSFVIIVIVLLILVWVVAARWPSGDTLVWAQLPVISTGLLTGIVFCLLIGAGLFVPGVAGTAIVVEREQQSWDFLSLTQLRPASIVLGKALSAVGMYLILIIALFPVFGSLYFLVGVDWAQSVVSLGLVLLTAVTCSFAGVASSAWTRRTGPAIAWSYVSMLFVMGLPTAILLGMISFAWRTVFRETLTIANVLFPIISPYPVLLTSSFGRFTSFSGVWMMFAGNVVYQCLLIGVFFIIALAGVKRRQTPAAPGGLTSASPPPLPRRRERVPLRQRLRERRWRRRKPRPPIPDRSNPIALREVWWGTVGSARTLRATGLLLVSVSAVFTMVLWANSWRDVEIFLPVCIAIHGILITVLGAGLSAGLFAKEHELRGMDMLRITLMTPRDVVRGKFIAGLRTALVLSVISVPANAPLYIVASNRPEAPLIVYLAAQVTVMICAALAVSLALAVSVLARRTSTAVVGGFIATSAAFFGLPALLALLSDAFTVPSGSAEFLLVFASPVVGFFYAADRYGPLRVDGGEDALEFLALWAVNSLTFILVTLAVYMVARACYARYRARES